MYLLKIREVFNIFYEKIVIKEKILIKSIKKIVNIIKDLLSPFFWFYFLLEKVIFYLYNDKEKAIIVFYISAVLLQAIIIWVRFGIEGLSFVSLKFSVVIGIFIIFSILFGYLFSVIFIFSVLLGAIMFNLGFLIIIFIALFLLKILFEKLGYSLDKKGLDKIDKITTFFIFMNIISVIISFIFGFFSFFTKDKPVKIISNTEIIIGKMLFFNGDYFFIESCGNKFIIPSSEVKKVIFLCENLQCKNLKEFNKQYQNYCKYLKIKYKNISNQVPKGQKKIWGGSRIL